jgi:hypothetical protein
MRRLFIASLCLAGLAAVSGLAEEDDPLPPAPVVASGSPIARSAETQDPAVEHLLKAAEHLEAAGLNDDAARLRHDAERRVSQENLLSRKESELECLQEEVDRLRALLGQATNIQIDVVAVEVDRRKLGLKAVEFDKLIGLIHAPSGGESRLHGSSALVEANPVRLPLLKDLCERGILKVLAEPSLTTTSGRPANFSDGGEIAVRVKSPTGEVSLRNVRFGTDLEVVPEMRANQRLRLQTSFELRELKSNVIDDEGIAHPEIVSRRLNTQVEMQFGQTLTLGRLVASRDGNNGIESIETIVFVTPRLISSGILPRPDGTDPAENELQDDDTLQPIVPAAFDPTSESEFGPAIPILKRRPVKD